jgi:hypothetical protein
MLGEAIPREANMGNHRTPQTLKKRQRERDKQMKRMEKIARRIERNSTKRAAKNQKPAPDTPLPVVDHGPDAIPTPASTTAPTTS